MGSTVAINKKKKFQDIISQINEKNQVQTESKMMAFGLVWFVEFYGISTFVGYLTSNPFLCK